MPYLLAALSALVLSTAGAVEDAAVPSGPRPMPVGIPIPAGSPFGFSGHMMHNDLIYGDKFSSHWRLEYTLPWVVEGRFGWMREPLYKDYFQGDSPEAVRNRALIERYLSMYDDSGVRVLLCPMFPKVGSPGFDEFFAWIGQLAKGHPSIAAIEMHNEPNLPFFFNGTPEDYADSCIAAAGVIRSAAPQARIVIGSISHLWWGPGIGFLKKALRRGILDVADGVSAHPYRKASPPEGGSLRTKPKDPQGFEKEIGDFYAMIQDFNATGKPLDLFFTEFGYSSGQGESGVADQSTGVEGTERQADYTSRMMLIMLEMRLRGVPLEGLFLYDLKCDGEDAEGVESNFGLVHYDAASAKPGYYAYRRIAETFGAVGDWLVADVARTYSDRPEAVKSFAWSRLSDGAITLAYWRMNQLQPVDEDFTSEVVLTLPAGFVPGELLHTDLATQIAPDAAAGAVPYALVDGTIRFRTTVTARAGWVVLQPRKPQQKAAVAIPWQHVLPASYAVPGSSAVIALAGPRSVGVGENLRLSLTVDNSKGNGVLAGNLDFPGALTPFSVPAGVRREFSIVIPAQPEAAWFLGRYLLSVADALIGRGDFIVRLPAPPK